MKQYINGNLVDLTAEEETIREEEKKKYQEFKNARKDAETTVANNRASGKAKLKAGEALTDAEISALFGD